MKEKYNDIESLVIDLQNTNEKRINIVTGERGIYEFSKWKETNNITNDGYVLSHDTIEDFIMKFNDKTLVTIKLDKLLDLRAYCKDYHPLGGLTMSYEYYVRIYK